MEALTQNAFLEWVRGSGSLWGFPFFLFMHTLGLATLAGISGAINLRLLGFGRQIPLSSLTGFFRVLWVAFAVTAVAGTVLLLADTTKMQAPVFWVKIGFIIVALVTMQMLRSRVFRAPDLDTRPLPGTARVLAIASFVFWIGATTAGRLMAYLGPSISLD